MNKWQSWLDEAKRFSHKKERPLKRGPKKGASKKINRGNLTVDEVLEIKRDLGRGVPIRELEERHNVSYNSIWRIHTGKTYRHVK